MYFSFHFSVYVSCIAPLVGADKFITVTYSWSFFHYEMLYLVQFLSQSLICVILIQTHQLSWLLFVWCIFSVSVQLLSRVQLFVTPWTAARQASLSITNSWSLPKLISIKSVMPSNHLILCRPLLLLPSIFPNIRVFSDESALHIRWQKYWSFSFNISPSNEYPGLISFRMDWLDLLDVSFTVFLFSAFVCTIDSMY